MKREEFEAKFGKLPSDTVYINLDEQEQEKITAGWTDDMIRRNSVSKIKEHIRQVECSIENMRGAIESERARLEGLNQVLARKLELE